MKDRKFIKILSTFTKEELKEFRKFLGSPYGAGRNSIALFDYVIKYHPTFDSDKLSSEKICSKEIDGKMLTVTALNNHLTHLANCVEKFMSLNNFFIDKINIQLNLAEAYYSKKLYQECLDEISLIEKDLIFSFSTNKDYVNRLKKIEDLKFECYNYQGKIFDLPDSFKLIFEAVTLNYIFDHSLYKENLKTAAYSYTKEKLTTSKLIKSAEKNIKFDKLLEHFDNDENVSTDYLKLHYLRIKTISHDDENMYFKGLKDLLLKVLSEQQEADKPLDRFERFLFFAHLMNYCERKKLNNWEEYEDQAYPVYKGMIEYNAYSQSENHPINLIVCRNIILNFFSHTDFKILDFFLENYLVKVQREFQNLIKNYGYAHSHYLNGKFEDSLSCSAEVKNEPNLMFAFNFDIRNLELKNYFELNYFDSAQSSAEAYKHYINNNPDKLNDTFKENLRTFIECYLKLFRIKFKKQFREISLAEKEIIDKVHPLYRKWFKKKFNELKLKQAID